MARPKLYRIALSTKERSLVKKIQQKTESPTVRTRCAILLAADETRWGPVRNNTQIANMSGASVPTVVSTLKLFCSGGIKAAVTLSRNPNSDTARLKATGDVEAQIIAVACSSVPEGRSRWTLSLLTDEMKVILEEPISRSTIGRVLQRNELRPHLNEYWCIPPKEDAEFVAHMEDVLDIYQQPYDPKRPLWCMDEKPYQLLGESREPIPMRPGDIAKTDSEYVRNGTASIFCFIQPHSGRIFHFTEPTRTAVDWAEKVRFLVDTVEPDADKVVLVMDNLNTHSVGSLYKAFPPAEARRIAKKLEIHYTPKHGSWLNIAEIGINIMTRECLGRRIESFDRLSSELAAWNDSYNQDPSPINWQFQTDDSRVKLRKLYPDIERIREEREARAAAKVADPNIDQSA